MKSISGKEFCKIIEKKGWVLKRINGSHYVFGKEDHESLIVVPVHKNKMLKTGLLKSLMKFAALEERDL